MINKHPPFKGLNVRIPSIIPMKGRGVVYQGFGLRPKLACKVKAGPRPKSEAPKPETLCPKP